ncbi:MAG: beta-galactosidase, partial [Clostridiales bacterium]|nr:beta-galactosidase [Clostridiales bacterium]
MRIPRPEHPRPQMVREKWLNLNGTWEFECDFGKSGKERGVPRKERLDKEIVVPFCPESELSGIGYKDFINAVWYKRAFRIPGAWGKRGVLLHFEAVDYDCDIWVNGEHVGSHKGGYTPFSFDVTRCITDGENTVVVYAEDDTRTGLQPCGKQSKRYLSEGCDYTRVTGIWQTVWLESVPEAYVKSYKVIPDVENSKADITLEVSGAGAAELTAVYDGRTVGAASVKTAGGTVNVSVPLSELHLWQPRNAALYDLEIRFGDDCVKGYFGMRTLRLTENCVLINEKPVFQRLALDQGYYPDGIYTAPNDAALVKDIELSLALGFNGARLHEKVFERRFLYHADRMGYLVWGEYG